MSENPLQFNLIMNCIEQQSEKLIADMFGVLFYATIGEHNVVALDHFKMGMRVLIQAREDAKTALAQLKEEGLFSPHEET